MGQTWFRLDELFDCAAISTEMWGEYQTISSSSLPEESDQHGVFERPEDILKEHALLNVYVVFEIWKYIFVAVLEGFQMIYSQIFNNADSCSMDFLSKCLNKNIEALDR